MAKEASRLDYLKYNVRDFILGEKKYQVQPIITITLWLHFLIFLLFGGYGYFGALYFRSKKFRFENLLLLTMVGLSFFIATLYFESALILEALTPHSWDTDNVVVALLTFWLYMLPSAPLGALIMAIWDSIKDIFRPLTADVQLERRKKEQEKEEAIRRRKAEEVASQDVPQAHGYITLGAYAGGNMFPSYTDVEVRSNLLRFDAGLLNKHIFIVGTTGAGKTETQLRIIAEILNNTDRRIYFVDGKGDAALAGKVATLIYNIKGKKVPIFKLGYEHSGAPYNGFSGSTSAIYNRLAEMSAVNEEIQSGGARHYAEIRKRILQLICGLGHPELKIEPPRSFEEVIDRIDLEWLSNAYRNTPRERKYVDMASNENQIFGLSTQMANLSSSFGHIINPNGFTLEDTPYAIFSLKTQSAGVDAKSFLDFFVTDVKDFIANRITAPTEIIIDEFGTFKNQNITEVLSLARGSETGVILGTQDVVSLGDEVTRKKILANCNSFFLMKTNFPEDVASLAGTVIRIEATQQMMGGEHTGLGSGREQHQFNIQPNDVRKLDKGEGFFINSGYACRAKVARVGDVPFRPESIAPIIETTEGERNTVYIEDEITEATVNVESTDEYQL